MERKAICSLESKKDDEEEEEEEEEENEDVMSLLKRYKERILFMSRDVQPVVICAAIKLIDCMRRTILFLLGEFQKKG